MVNKMRIPVLVLYLGGHSSKHWYGGGKTEGTRMKGVFASLRRHSYGEHWGQSRAP